VETLERRGFADVQQKLENKDVHVDIDMEIGDDCSGKFDWKQNNMSPLREEG
jgi:hypothetical protein